MNHATQIRGRARWQVLAFGGGVVLMVAGAVGGVFDPVEFFRSYLMGFLFWLGLALGSLAISMMQYLTAGAWGVVTRRTLEAATRTLPLLALMFIPIAIGIPYLYPWSDATKAAADEVMRHRSGYLNPHMFILRAIGYFAIWGVLAYLLNRWSREEDEGAARKLWMEKLSAPGLIIYVFTMTFAAVDWAESLSSHWYSTMWGFLFIGNQGLAAMSFVILMMAVLATHNVEMAEALRPSHFQDLGKLLLMFVMLWAYFAFSQFLIVWSGNLAAEIPWYVRRIGAGWKWIGLSLIVLQFAVPFLLLLSRTIKRRPWLLAGVVCILLVMRAVDMFWMVMPSFEQRDLRVDWLNVCVPLAMGGLWFGSFLQQWARRPLLPVNDPELESAVHHGA